MRIELLNIFFTIVETGSISQTARKHYISQPAVTSQLQSLEDEVSKKLFTRSSGQRKPLVLTEAGEIFLEYAKKLVDIYQEMDNALSKLDANFEKLVIGTGPTIGTYIFPFLMKVFQKDFPHIPISTSMVLGPNLHAGLQNRDFDMIITSNIPKGSDFVYDAILDDQLVLITSDNTKIDDMITINRFKKLPLVIRENDSTINRRVNLHLSKHGFEIKDLNVVQQAYGNEAVKQAVNAGMGFGFVAKSSISDPDSIKKYKIIRIKGLKIERQIYLIHTASRHLTTSMVTFRKFVLLKRWLEGTPLV